MAKKKKSAQETSAVAEPIVIEEPAAPKGDLLALLEEIKNYEGVVGYIVRDTSTASMNLDDPAKTTDYAILSSLAFDASRDLSRLFELGNVESSVFDGGKIKMLSVRIGKKKVSIFTQKDMDLGKILMKLHPS